MAEDPHFQTAMVSARLITGDEDLFRRLAEAVETKRRKSPEALITTARGERDERAKKFGTAGIFRSRTSKKAGRVARFAHRIVGGYAGQAAARSTNCASKSISRKTSGCARHNLMTSFCASGKRRTGLRDANRSPRARPSQPQIAERSATARRRTYAPLNSSCGLLTAARATCISSARHFSARFRA